MTRTLKMALPVALVAALAAPVLAGGPDCGKGGAAATTASHHGKKCDMSAGDCKKMMAGYKTSGWLGIDAEKTDDGSVLVKKVHAGGPAEKAGIAAGDVLLAMNGVTFQEENHEKLMAMKKASKPGDTVTYNVRHDGSDRNVVVALGAMPEEVYTAMVKDHMKEHTEIASAN